MQKVREDQRAGPARTAREQQQATGGRALIVDKPRFAQLMSRMLQGRFEVVSADGPSEGLRTVREVQPDLIIADLGAGGGLRMAELLAMSVWGRHIPFILTCIKPQSDLVDRARNAGVDIVLCKPFAPSTLIERAGDVLKVARRGGPRPDDYRAPVDFLRAHPKSIEGLPSIPDTHVKVRQLSGTESSVKSDVAEQVGMGPALEEAVLDLVATNPAVFPRRVATLRGAVTLGGFCEVSSLVLAYHAYQALSGYPASPDLDRIAFWKHSVGTAMVGRTIAKRVKEGMDSAFVAGFLHDAGKLVLDRFYQEFYSPVTGVARRQRVHSLQVELPMLGTTHAHVGAHVATQWHLEEHLTEAILAHHAPTAAKKNTRLASVIHVADAICRYLNHGSSGEVVRQETDDPALYKSLVKLGVGPQVLEQLIEMAEKELKPADAFLDALMGVGSEAAT